MAVPGMVLRNPAMFSVVVAAVLMMNTKVAPGDSATIDLRHAVIQILPDTPAATADFLSRQITRRSGPLNLKVHKTTQLLPETGIALQIDAAVGLPAEGYQIQVRSVGDAAVVHIVGADPRGLLFGAGRLVRLMNCRMGHCEIDRRVAVTSSPKYPIRGHQLGYRNTANTYDAWTVDTFRDYIDDLVVFGTNAIELIPPFEPGTRDSVHMKQDDAWTMNQRLGELITDMGLQCWLWVPATEDLTQPAQAHEALEKRRRLFQSMKHIDAVFVPGGDDGSNDARVLMPWLEQMAEILHAAHPKAEVWVSHQTFAEVELEYFFHLLQEQQPKWLTGVIQGPWAEISLEETRAQIPKQYGLRRYPDITHNVRCEFPVPNWDRAFALTLGREAVNPRPHEMAQIHNLHAPLTVGSIAYSDGAHDDLNKIIWSARGWDPEMPVDTILNDYGKVFFGDQAAASAALGLSGLETNWQGPVDQNAAIPQTLQHWRDVLTQVPANGDNWRWQMYQMRAVYDAYVQQRQRAAASRQNKVMQILAAATGTTVSAALADSRRELAVTDGDAAVAELRREIEELGEVLFKSIGFQLSIRPPYSAKNSERGAVLDYLDQPLNHRSWLESRFTRIEAANDASTQLAMIREIVHWEDAGPGGFYDDLGYPGRQPHLVRQKTHADDPSGMKSPRCDSGQAMDNQTQVLSDERLSSIDVAETLFGTPLRMRYEQLDAKGRYRLRVTYAGRYNASMTLTADGTHEIHSALPQPRPTSPVELAIPAAATADGALDLEWNLVSGRGCQVAEVWLIRE